MKKRRKRNQKKSTWSIFFRPIKVIFTLLFVVLLLGAVTGGIVLVKYKDDIVLCREKADAIIEKSTREDFSQPSDTRVYDSEGAIIGTINSGHYEYVPITEISQNLQDAYISQEDKRFLKHHGVDLIGLMRAGLMLVKNKGEITQGGSTITQQVIKNTYLTQERSFTRKITELFAAPQMEKKYSKADIMEFYCNTNFYANRCYGVAEASRYYFDKEAKDLEVWEAAMLAGISNNPSRYDPVAHPGTALKKRNQVLSNMEKNGMLTAARCAAAKAEPLTIARIYEAGTSENYQTTYAVYCAALELMKNDGFEFQYLFKDKEDYDAYKAKYQEAYQAKADLIRNGGFEIHTSLDSSLQTLLQDSIDTTLESFTDVQENGKLALQGAAVCVDNKTGYVVAISGGRGTDDEYNRGFLSKRQPGSTIKPLIDYAPAFETGYYYPSRIVNDHLFENGPKNSGKKYYGDISVREALNRSLNTVAWQVLSDIGVDTGMDYLAKMKFAGLSYMDVGNTSMSIGGFTEGARVVDMAKGYSVLANGGLLSNNTCIKGIVSQYEGEVYQWDLEEERIFTEDTAYMITDVLKGTLDKPYGTGSGLGLSVPAAGKTGTTNSNKDTWFCGYTKYYTTAVWVGYDTPKAMPGVFGKTYAGKIWHDFMEQSGSGLPAEDWEMPSTVAYYNVDWRGEKTNASTGKKDLFSSVTEEKAKANLKKWTEEEDQKDKQAQAAQARRESEAAINQAIADLAAVINELNALTVRDSGTQDFINRAASLLETINGTEQYETLKQQLDAASAYATALPEKQEEVYQPVEVGPGGGPGVKPGVSPGMSPGMSPGEGPGDDADGAQNVGPGGF